MTRTRTFMAAGAMLLVASIALAAFGGSASAATRNVSVADNVFTDSLSGTSTTTIVVGDTVVWTWSGANPHSVTADDNSFDSNPPPVNYQTGGTFSRIFNTPGTYEYYCRFHSTATANLMNGTIVVQVAPTATNTVAVATNTPAAATSTPVPGTPTSTRTPGPTNTGTPLAAATAQPTSGAAAPTPPGGGAAPSVQAPVAGVGVQPGDGGAFRWISLVLAAAGAIAIGAAVVSRRRA